MTVDWGKYRRIVDDAMRKWGRSVTFVKAAGPNDPDDPLGPSGIEMQVSGVMAVFVSPGSGLGFERHISPGLLANSSQIALVLPSLIHDFRTFTKVIDGSEDWKITQVDELRSSSVPVLYYVGLRL